jgi:hypothetical protein
MPRRCTTTPGLGTCCRAAQQGLLNRPFIINTTHGQRCAECTTDRSQSRDPRKAGRTIFRFRFHRGTECGIGPGGCPFLQGGGGGALPAPGGGGPLTLAP